MFEWLDIRSATYLEFGETKINEVVMENSDYQGG